MIFVVILMLAFMLSVSVLTIAAVVKYIQYRRKK